MGGCEYLLTQNEVKGNPVLTIEGKVIKLRKPLASES